MNQSRFDACMQGICNGDKTALKEIYEEYMKYVFTVIYQVVGNHDDAEDLTADFFVKLWTSSDKYVPGSSHKAYLATIARHMAIDFLRKHNKEILISEFTTDPVEETSEGSSSTMVLADSKSPSVESEVIEDMSLKDALDKLKPREREVINMKVMYDMTFKEIAQATGSPMGTITWLYQQAIKKLRRCGYE